MKSVYWSQQLDALGQVCRGDGFVPTDIQQPKGEVQGVLDGEGT